MHVVSMKTAELKDKLNQIFAKQHGHNFGKANAFRDPEFDRLWDLKEKALIDGAASVDLPRHYVDELEDAIVNSSPSKARQKH